MQPRILHNDVRIDQVLDMQEINLRCDFKYGSQYLLYLDLAHFALEDSIFTFLCLARLTR